MVKSYIYWRGFCKKTPLCLLLSALFVFAPAAHAQSAVSAEFYLQSIEPDPSMPMLYNFLDIYAKHFADCQETPTFLRALSYLAKNKEFATLRKKARALDNCKNLTQESRNAAQKLLIIASEHSAPVKEPVKEATKEATKEAIKPAPMIAASPKTSQQATQIKAPEKTNTVKTPQKPLQTHVKKPKLPVRKAFREETQIAAKPVIKPATDSASQSNASVLTAPETQPKEVTKANQTTKPPYSTILSTELTLRSGDKGTSRLARRDTRFLVGFNHFSLSLSNVHLDSGKALQNAFVGSFYLAETVRPTALLTTKNVLVPELKYQDEKWSLSVGSTPLGGEIAALPTFRFTVKPIEHLQVSLFQESVTDSLMSHIGFTDIFSGKKMGRVVKAGAKIAWDDTFSNNWFYGGTFTAAHFYGKNVKGNHAVKAEFYIGKSLGEFSVGSYSAIDRYSTNLNNYTFGHGGYYSPQMAAATALFGAWERKNERGRIKFDLSAGVLRERTNDAHFYYGAPISGGNYLGKTEQHITIGAGLEAELFITKNLHFGTTLHFMEAGSFNEKRGQLFMKWDF